MRYRLAHAVAPLMLIVAACASSSDAGSAPDTASTSNADTTVADGTTPDPVDTIATVETSGPVDTSETESGPETGHETDHGADVDPDAVVSAYLGAAPFQDVAVAEAAGWVSTIDTLGCFENDAEGGMGVHWLNESLLDAELDPGQPEALVYELDANGEVAGLVGHEYLVPFEAWADDDPPQLFGQDLHEHPVLPFWILHLYIWKDNPVGMFADWNPAIRMCPDGVGVFGVDLP